MAKMTIAKSTNSPICSNGAIALMMDFKTTCRPIREMKLYYNCSKAQIEVLDCLNENEGKDFTEIESNN